MTPTPTKEDRYMLSNTIETIIEAAVARKFSETLAALWKEKDHA